MQISVDKENMRVEDGKLIIDITSDIEKVLNASKVQLGTLKEGAIFKIGNKEFIVLEHTEKGVGIIQKNFVFSCKFGTCADWRISGVRYNLNNGPYYDSIAKEVGADNIIPMERDLTSWDGLKDYGTCVDKITILSAPEYSKFHKILGLKSNYPDWQWLLTPYSTPSNDYPRYVCIVDNDGSLNWTGCDCCNSFRPFLILNPSVLVVLV